MKLNNPFSDAVSCLDRDVLDHTRQLDRIIGSFRIMIALFIVFVELNLGHTSPRAMVGYTLLFLYSTLWLLMQARYPSPKIGKWGYFHFVVDLLVMGTFTFLKSTLTTSYHDGLYIILVLIYLVRFGKQVAISFAVIVSAIIIYVCLCRHFEHNISLFILLGTMLAVIYFVGNIMDLEKSLREKLRYLSTHDQLTGVYNFRYFQEQLIHELERAHRYQRSLSLVIFDIDDFKKYNDSFGHDAGNLVLQAVGKLIEQHIRKTDIIARYGGEEFVLIMPETDKIGAVTVTERIRQAISSHDFPHRQITVSAGITEYPAEAQDAQELFKKADNLLYQAKSSGKNCSCY